MRILLTNDDGIEAPGLDVLEKIATDLTDDVWVVAPETDNSGASHSLTLAEPLRMREIGKRRYAVKGTPTDCVHLALAGLALGLGLHSYNAFIAVPFLVLGWMLTEVIAGRSKRLWEMRVGFVYLFGIAALLFLPLGRYMMDEPGNYLLRVTTRVTATEVPLPPNPLWVLIQNMLNSLGMFNYHGDLVSVLNVVGVRQFGLVAAAMLPLGVVYLGARPRYANNLAVLITILVMLLPSALSIAFPREVPNTGRAIGALVPAIIASSVALDAIRRSLAPPSAVKPLKDAADQPEAQLAAAAAPRRRVIRRGQILAWGLVAVLLAAETAAAYPYYFERFRTNLPQSNYSISLEMARVMDAYADQGRVYIKTQGHWYDGNAVRAQLRRLSNWNDEFWELVPGTAPLDDLRGKVLVIVHPDDTAAIETLRRAFTSHSIEKHYNYDGEPTFIAFYGER